jgi:ABC-type uncharacterized transport system substrate-binding protein
MINPSGEFAAAGGLMSCGTDVNDQVRIAAAYTGPILKGEKPAKLLGRPHASSCSST